LPGLQIQQQLAEMNAPLPLIIISSHDDVSLTVEVMRRGAFHYLQKPVRAVEVWEAIQQALEVDRQRRELQAGNHRLTESLAVLQPREREMLRLIAEDTDSRTMAQQLGVSVRTIEMDRSRVMRKLGLKSPNALLHFALRVHPGRTYAKLIARQNLFETAASLGLRTSPPGTARLLTGDRLFYDRWR
jgi:two-component system, LuxR family, response regulator FixJ